LSKKKKMKIFVMHHPKLVERKKNVLKQLDSYGLKAEFITNHNPEDFAADQNIWNYIFQKFNLHIKPVNQGPMTLPKASLTMKHIEALYQFVSNTNEDYALIFEDDIVLDDNFLEKLNKYIALLPKGWELFFIGEGCNIHIEKEHIKENVNIYKRYSSRCSDSYLITKSCAKKIIDDFNSRQLIYLHYDHYLTDIIKKYDFSTFWAEPTIVKQGSVTGLYKSSLDP